MIRIIKGILYNVSWTFLFSSINKIKFINILNNLNAYLRTLKLRELFRILNILISDKLSDNSVLRPVIYPFEIELKVLVDNVYKKIFLFGFIFTIITNVWFNLFKKIFLLPFKLGIFSFIYSILGFDVSWFLNIFNFFSINIPNWVYIQFITLYNNWLTWWYQNVNIKSITSVPVKDIKKIKNNVNKDVIEIETPGNNTVWYIIGAVTIVGGICFALWYFDCFNSSKPGPEQKPVASVVSNVAGNAGIVSPVGDNAHQIQVTNNQTSTVTPAAEPVAEVNNAWSFRAPSNVDATSSSAVSNPWDGPPSPTGSTDSSETIRTSNSGRPMLLLRKK